MLELLIVIDHPVDLFPLFVAMVVAVFIDHKQKDDKRNRQGYRKPKGIDYGVQLVSPQKSEGRKEVVPEHLVGCIKMIQLI